MGAEKGSANVANFCDSAFFGNGRLHTVGFVMALAWSNGPGHTATIPTSCTAPQSSASYSTVASCRLASALTQYHLLSVGGWSIS